MHFSRQENWSQGHQEYLELFANADQEIYLGEASTEYAKRPFREGVAQRLFEFNPSARVIYLMRDPFERVVSQYKHMVRAKRETRAFSEALARPSDYITNSHYAYQLAPYLELFGADMVYLDTFESLRMSPAGFCERLFRWLEADPGFVPPNLGRSFNVSPAKIEHLDDRSWRARLAGSLGRLDVLRALTPGVARERIKSLVPRQVVVDFQSDEFRSEVARTRSLLAPLLRGWVDELAELTGRSYQAWPIVREPVDDVAGPAQELPFWLPPGVGPGKDGNERGEAH
jgi:hypothetical protein